MQGAFHQLTSLPVGVVDIDTGYYFQLYRMKDGSVQTVGNNELGQLGDGTTISRATPRRIDLAPVAAISAGGTHGVLANPKTPEIATTPASAAPTYFDARTSLRHLFCF